MPRRPKRKISPRKRRREEQLRVLTLEGETISLEELIAGPAAARLSVLIQRRQGTENSKPQRDA